MFRWISSLFSFALFAGAALFLNQRYPNLKDQIWEWVDDGKLHTLEARYTALQIMETHKRRLLKDSDHQFLEPQVKFAPYLLMEVKYTQQGHTGEGILLWDLCSGEMVIETQNWSKTHGFCDCIANRLDKHEFKVVRTIAKNNGHCYRADLLHELDVDQPMLGVWLDNCLRKKIIVQQGDQFRLHLQNPKLNVKPETVIDDRLVTKAIRGVEKLQGRFSTSQIKKAAEFAFGQDFAVRSSCRVFLPIYAIFVQNPDGSIHTSYWNAINGQELPFSAVMERR